MNIENDVKNILNDILNLNLSPKKIDTSKSFLEMGFALDSLTGLRIVLAIEEKFDFKIKTGSLTREVFQSIDNLVSFVKENLQN